MNGARIAGLILAGGRSSRFDGGRKDRALLGPQKLIDHVIARAAPQVAILAVSRAIDDHEATGPLPVVYDSVADKGPLAGVAAGLVWASSSPQPADYLATFPCDTPLLPTNLVERLLEAARNGRTHAAIASSGGDIHPACALWPATCAPLAAARLRAGELSLMGLAEAAGAAIVDFGPDSARAFVNVNTAAALAALAAELREARE